MQMVDQSVVAMIRTMEIFQRLQLKLLRELTVHITYESSEWEAESKRCARVVLVRKLARP